MLKNCINCNRLFDHPTEVLCEKCRSGELKGHVHIEKHHCACGQLFVPIDPTDSECSNCKKKKFEYLEEEEKMDIYKKIREYLYSNPNTPKVSISDRFGVPLKQLAEWIDHGRIIEIDHSKKGK